ncbi:hypothetical protein CC1G_07192 [Coprinopsis cinerea okayama7|uniref:Uncharacterized protein n=1 Tax=Coprinopsis cinerea (strain Okayama-7 / 130 / ATCC MYA-4618 / FGSC 9003) TaxID=240176 RepID=A8NRE7_COPC7|nr:hypothetical protein CC1G_07192 [Coprinopsis cinerea okayama7\|eukprot:XP_001835768.2 hypothetical protein CC1G_07192 [Coprinopsis cinerea okayama7\
MALAQPMPMRLPGPSWDEEVVPALRKRLESESRTLSKRMSAISLSADDVPMPPMLSELTSRSKAQNSSHARGGSSIRTAGPSPMQMENSTSGSTASTSRSIPNPAKPPAPQSSNYQRSRTYSQPDTVHVPKLTTKMRRNITTADSTKSTDSSRSRPTRIPKPSRAYGGYSNGNTPVIPQTNGFSTNSHGSRPLTSPATRSTAGFPNDRSTSGLLNEPPPFPPSSSTSSLNYSQNSYPDPDEAPPRPSIDSEERPFEHWYRGEVSRNGGVGELRVGRQQEMLEIANYGHMIRGMQRKPVVGWNNHQSPLHSRHATDDSPRRHRKRADSIAGITDVERVRGSILFDEEGMDAVGRVLDEHPLTDIEGEESDIASLASHHYRHGRLDHMPGVGDISTSTATPTAPTPTQFDETVDRSTTPQPRSSSSSRGYPPSRIPSRAARRSSESRAATPTMNNPPTVNGASTSKTPSPPPIPPQTSRSVSSQSIPSTNATPNGKRVVSPTSAKKRTPVKSLRGKQVPPALAKRDNSKEPRTVSQYPSPGDGENMADAIPTWTQPIPRTGNWDEVVLPVVARQKGLDEFYQTADGSPQPKKVETTIAPAPGTFGYDPAKYRRRDEGEAIPMDEFGRPHEQEEPEQAQRKPQPTETTTDEFRPYQETSSPHDETPLPVRGTPPPSPPPFSQYASPSPQIVANTVPPPNPNYQVQEEEDKGAGCCKCTIM